MIALNIEILIDLIVIICAAAGTYGYFNLKKKVTEIFTDVGTCWGLVYAIFVDLAAGKQIEMSKVTETKQMLEETWTDINDLAPFLQDILSKVPKAVV
ncbi:MAG TPA: hypothetical protein PLQ01_08570 [Methanothrix sp.]|nr:hypothetical protein [Methanothrix sp.]